MARLTEILQQIGDRMLRMPARQLARILWQLAFAIILLVVTFGANPTFADIPGAQDPRFQAALSLWLDDDEATALPALANLAREGNDAARILVGLIDKQSALQGPWLSLLPKRDRTEMLRSKGGLSGTSWLRKVKDIESIRLWLKVVDSKADIKTALRLSDVNEGRLTRVAFIALESRQVTNFDLYADDPRYPVSVRYLIWREWQKRDDNEMLAAALNALEPGDPQRAMISAGGDASLVEDWLAKTDLAPALKSLCQSQCPETVTQCMRAGYDTLGYRRFATQGTPLAALIPETRYAASKRGQKSVLRRAAAYAFMSEVALRPIAAIDSCFAGLLETESHNY